jgi:hypothetical protein
MATSHDNGLSVLGFSCDTMIYAIWAIWHGFRRVRFLCISVLFGLCNVPSVTIDGGMIAVYSTILSLWYGCRVLGLMFMPVHTVTT